MRRFLAYTAKVGLESLRSKISSSSDSTAFTALSPAVLSHALAVLAVASSPLLKCWTVSAPLTT